MATFNYAKIAARADRVMRRYGIPKTGNTANVKAYIRRHANNADTDYACVALEADYSPNERHGQIERTDTRYLVSDIELEIVPNKASDVFVLTTEDGAGSVVAESVWLLASEPKRIAPDGGTVVFWELHCRTQ